MDAKAKVVGWQYRRIDLDEADGIGLWKDCSENDYIFLSRAIYMQSHELRKLIPLTDHEAALAELAAENKKLGDTLVTVSKWCEEWKATHASLLTGLEALAGELLGRSEQSKEDLNTQAEIAYDFAAEAITTLTNSAKAST